MTVNAPASRKEAEKLYLGQDVRKYFEATEGFEGGWYSGQVVEVEKGLKERDGTTYDGLLFLVSYEDGDKEHVTFEALQSLLVQPNTPVHQPACTAAGQDLCFASAEPVEAGQFTGLTDITNQTKWQREKPDRQLTMTTATERRSRRMGKRKVDDSYEYEAVGNTVKTSAIPSLESAKLGARYGIRTPGGPTPMPLTAVLSSESEEEVPLANGVRAAGLPGHLLKIELINFMCHEHFTMEFGKHVTFVSGSNGSGKSAVLQALQCCLGVKASQTGRAPSFKHFVRTGTDEAIVRVTLHNKPYKDYDAFQHDVYGDLITVERRIARLGAASAYFLKDQNGRIHGRRREDLDALLHTLGINAANPVTVMTQDTARSFLAGSSATADREKWTLYMDATQLSQIRYNLEISKQQVTLMDEGVSKIRGEYEAMCAEHSQLQKSIEALRGLEAWRVEVQQYEHVLVWSMVDEHASNAAQVEEALATAVPERLQESQQKVEELSAEVEALREGTNQKEQFLRSFQQRAQELADQASGLQAEQKQAHSKLKVARRKLSQLERELQEESTRKESLVAAVEEACTQLAQDSQVITLNYTREVEQADREHKLLEAEGRQLAAVKEKVELEATEALNKKYRVEEELRRCSQQGRHLQENLKQLQQSKNNSVVRFGGPPMVALLKAIQSQKGRFHKPPIGPLGHFLTLSDPQWSTAVEVAIGFHLNSFLVSDLHDCTILQSLVRQGRFPASKRPSVHMVRFDLPAHTIPPHKQPHPSTPTVMRVLRCTHPQHPDTIFNHLVDAAGIEKLALGSTAEQCQQFGYETSGVRACFGIDGSKYYSRGKNTTSMGPPQWLRWQSPRLGDMSLAQQIKQLKEQQNRQQQEESALQEELNQAQHAYSAADTRARDARLALQSVSKQTWEARNKRDQLVKQPPPEVRAAEGGGEEGDEDEVQRDIFEATQVIVDLEQQLSEKQAEVEEAEQREKAAHEAYQTKKMEIERLTDENSQFLSTFESDVEQLQQAEIALQDAAASYELALKIKAQLEAKLEEQRTGAESCGELAAQICSREEAAAAKAELAGTMMQKEDMDEEKLAKWFTTGVMRKKIERLQKKIAEHEREAGGSLADLEVKLEAIEAKLNSDGRRFKTAIGAYNLIEGALERRFKKLSELYRNVSDSVNRRFNHYMSRKGHLGAIKLDTQTQTLQLKVQIGGRTGGDGCGKVKDLKQLSGGERSFTTVAFTLALGAQTDMPFRAMDEFDVFMDAVNRRVAMESLFGFAREHDELQFIFLTPQDIAAVEDARQGCSRTGMQLPHDFVKVVQMRAARQNATVV